RIGGSIQNELSHSLISQDFLPRSGTNRYFRRTLRNKRFSRASGTTADQRALVFRATKDAVVSDTTTHAFDMRLAERLGCRESADDSGAVRVPVIHSAMLKKTPPDVLTRQRRARW